MRKMNPSSHHIWSSINLYHIQHTMSLWSPSTNMKFWIICKWETASVLPSPQLLLLFRLPLLKNIVACWYFAYPNPISYYWKTSIQSTLDKPFFLCMWRCTNFVFMKPTKSNARMDSSELYEKGKQRKTKMQTATNYWKLLHFCEY